MIQLLEFGRDCRRGGEAYVARFHSYLLSRFEHVTPESLPRLPDDLNNAWKRAQYCLRSVRQSRPRLLITDISSATRNYFAARLHLKHGGSLALIVQSVPPSCFSRSAARRLLTRHFEKFLFRFANIVICNSEFTASLATERVRPDAAVAVARPGTEMIPPETAPARTETPARHFRLLYVGECSRVKGLIYAVKAMSLLRDRNILLDVAGGRHQEPYYADQVKKLISREGLGDRIIFHGFCDRETLSGLYRHASAFVMPSLAEGYGMSLAEAFGYGLPSVASSVGGIPELLEDGANGLAVPPADEAAIARAVIRLYEDESLCSRLGDAARKRALMLPTWDDFTQALDEQLKPAVISILEKR
ncbi:MAG: glycosyltransferase family 4 protein [Candidatus Zixiibacteriota bacterium]|nr:MAG: glycosyltransferase family 4 protein [candidate division Zixibacteria bacterium]